MSRRNRLTLSEQETIILWDNELDIASVYTHDQRIANKLKELAKKYPDVEMYPDFYCYPNDCFGDADHLNNHGVEVFDEFLMKKYTNLS